MIMSVAEGYRVVNFAFYLGGVLRLQPYMPSSVPPLCMLERPEAKLAVVLSSPNVQDLH